MRARSLGQGRDASGLHCCEFNKVLGKRRLEEERFLRQEVECLLLSTVHQSRRGNAMEESGVRSRNKKQLNLPERKPREPLAAKVHAF
jgi:hypothetical protein